MKSHRFWSLLIVAAILGFGALGLASAAQALKGRPTAVAVCDITRAFDALKEKAQVEADLQTRTQNLQQLENDKKNELRQLQSDLELLAPDTPAFEQKQMELERKSVELQAWAAYESAKLQRERAVQIEGLYRKMVDAIGRVAKENGFDIVLYKEPAINFRGAKPEQLAPLIQMRKVLYTADNLDITDLVLNTLNNEFVNRPR